MGFSRSGHARVSATDPRAFAICDRCGMCYNHYALSRQFQWGGASLFDEGYLVCRRCLDVPQDQFRSIILPPDPRPIINPRPDYYQTPPFYPGSPVPPTPGNLGFSQYELTIQASQSGGAQGIGQGGMGFFPIGIPFTSPGQENYPTDKGNALFSVQIASGVPDPGPTLVDYSTTVGQPNVPQLLLPNNPARTWLFIYSPGGSTFQIAPTPSTLWGLITNLGVGPGMGWFWATLQGNGPVYTGPVSVISQQVGAPLWAWDAAGNSPPTMYGNHGFTQYDLTVQASQAGGPQGIGQGAIGFFPIGVDFLPPGFETYPTDKGNALYSLQVATGIASPGATLVDYGSTVSKPNVSQLLVPSNNARTWLFVYNPGPLPFQFALAASTVWGSASNVFVGPGTGMFWADVQGKGPVYKGLISAVSLTYGAPLWAWDA